MRSRNGSYGPFMVILEFMERHGDLCGRETLQVRCKNSEKWEELTNILNSEFENDAKSLEKWRKAWVDFKSNIKKKYKKLRQEDREFILTDVEERVLQLLAGINKKKNSTQHLVDMEVQKIKNELETDSCEGDHSLTASTPPSIFCAVNEMTAEPRSRNNSSSSETSCSTSKHQKKKRKENGDDMNDNADPFVEFEPETETPIMKARNGARGQYMVMIEFMERHGDLCGRDLTVLDRRNSIKKWEELTGILNSKFENDAKSLEKWRKAWTDFKNNTKKKYEKLRQEGRERILTDAEERVLQFLRCKSIKKISTEHITDMEVQKIQNELETDSCEGDRSLTASTPPGISCAVNELTAAPRSRNNSCSSQASCSTSKHPPKKRKENGDDVNGFADRFLEFEREREKMAHEREMARIKQHDQLLSIFNGMVNVLETLAPSIKKFLDHSEHG